MIDISNDSIQDKFTTTEQEQNNEGYGNLTEQELYDFLNEIASSDEELEDAEAQSLDSLLSPDEDMDVSDEEADSEGPNDAVGAGQNAPIGTPNPIREEDLTEEERINREIEADYGEKAWWTTPRFGYYAVMLRSSDSERAALKMMANNIPADRRKKPTTRETYRERRLAIRREAFDQNIIDLNSEIGVSNLKLLISLLVEEHTRMVDKYHDYINRRLTILLRPLIPLSLKNCKKRFPNSIVPSPGFLYQASKAFGDGLTFWATPDVPYFFEQNSETEALRLAKASFLIAVDKAVLFYHEHSKKRADKEVKCASTLYLRNVKTYFDLLRLNPFWFDKLYKYLLENGNT